MAKKNILYPLLNPFKNYRFMAKLNNKYPRHWVCYGMSIILPPGMSVHLSLEGCFQSQSQADFLLRGIQTNEDYYDCICIIY